MVDAVELQEVDDFIPKSSDDMKFPCIIIEGVTTEEEVLYFNSKFCDANKSLPLYIEFDGIFKKIGSFELTLDNLLVVRSIDRYKIKLATSKEKLVDIDTESPDNLIKFITLSGV